MKPTKDNELKMIGWALHAAGVLAVALVLGTFYKLGYARLADQSETYAGRTEQLTKLLATAEDVQKRHRTLRQELDELEQSIATMRARLPMEIERESFEKAIRVAATEAQFTIGNTLWKSPETTPTHSRVDVTVSGAGSFASICRFLSEINQLARITKIRRLQLETDEKSQAYPLKVTFVLVYGVESHDTEKKGGVS